MYLLVSTAVVIRLKFLKQLVVTHKTYFIYNTLKKKALLSANTIINVMAIYTSIFCYLHEY